VEEAAYDPKTQTIFWLQWGHGDEAVEEIGDHLRFELAHVASMGPRR